MCELSVYTLKRYFVPFFVNTHEKVLQKFSPENGKNQENTIQNVHPDDGARPSTSKDTGEGAKKLEKKGEHSKWISFLNDFNMQYIPIKIIMK